VRGIEQLIPILQASATASRLLSPAQVHHARGWCRLPRAATGRSLSPSPKACCTSMDAKSRLFLAAQVHISSRATCQQALPQDQDTNSSGTPLCALLVKSLCPGPTHNTPTLSPRSIIRACHACKRKRTFSTMWHWEHLVLKILAPFSADMARL